jgi:hypothetical protein
MELCEFGEMTEVMKLGRTKVFRNKAVVSREELN